MKYKTLTKGGSTYYRKLKTLIPIKGKYEKDLRIFIQIQTCMAAVLCIHLPPLVYVPGADSDP